MTRLTILITAVAFMFLFAGCGQSGPLYVPGNPTKIAVPPPQETVSDEAPKEAVPDTDEGSDTD